MRGIYPSSQLYLMTITYVTFNQYNIEAFKVIFLINLIPFDFNVKGNEQVVVFGCFEKSFVL